MKLTEQKQKLTTVVSLLLITLFMLTSCSGFLPNQIAEQGNTDTSTIAESEENANPTVNNNGKVTLRTATFVSDGISTSQSLDVSDIASGMMPCMVAITNISVQEVENFFGIYGGNRVEEIESSGSGIIVGENESELLIVTNNHVIENATTLSVCFADNKACEALLKGASPDYDLAVIAVKLSDIPNETKEKIAAAVFGSSDELRVGEQVVAIGNALGYGQSVTTGIVSALNRKLSTCDAVMLQTDAAINPGNSGGALLNMDGEVIGINSAKYSSTEVEGMGYAIAVSQAKSIIEELLNRETREKVDEANASYIGITAQDVSADIESYYGIPQGVYINGIVKDSAAHLAGLTKKTVITHFDGMRVTSIANLKNRLEYYAAGEEVTLTVQVYSNNSYTEQTITITLGSVPDGYLGSTF
ncbi:MAG: S1C family serine protease [Eubacteriales bacterium]